MATSIGLCRRCCSKRLSGIAVSSLHTWPSSRRIPMQPGFSFPPQKSLTISAVHLGDSSESNGEFFKPTAGFSGAGVGDGSDSVAQAANTVSQQAVDFASVGLGGYWPSGWIQSAMELLHNHAHLPWWGCIVALTAILRLAYFPVAVKMQIVAAKVANINKDAKGIQERILACKASGDKLGESQAGVEMMKLYQRGGANPLQMFPLGLGQMPIFLSMFRGLSGMVNLPLESLRTGGTLWFTDLVVPDLYYCLPLLACSSFLVNIELGGEGGAATENDLSRRIRWVLRVGAVGILPFTVTFPSAILVYWVSNSLFSTMQILLFKLHPVKRLFGIPLVIK